MGLPFAVSNPLLAEGESGKQATTPSGVSVRHRQVGSDRAEENYIASESDMVTLQLTVAKSCDDHVERS